MKRIISLLLVLTMMLTGLALAEDIPKYDLTPSLTNSMEKTAAEWFATSLDRAMLTVLISLDFLDCPANTAGYEPVLSQTSYVGKNGTNLIIFMKCGEQDVLIEYSPSRGQAKYALMDPVPDANMQIMKTAISNNCDSGCYENSSSDIYTIVEMILEILES